MTPVWQIRGRHPSPHDHVGPGAILGCTLGLLQELLADALLLWVARLVAGKPGEFGSHLEILKGEPARNTGHLSGEESKRWRETDT